MGTYLDRILRTHREVAGSDGRSLDSLIDEARDAPPTRGFRRTLKDPDSLAVIAEVKRRSPSKGDLNIGLNAAELAQVYGHSGARALSVLTDAEFFGGSVEDLQAARSSVDIPVLRKDFTVDARDVCDARIMGADCVLLIAAALDDSELADFSCLGYEIGLDVLIEVHDEGELERAIAMTRADLIGVNQRDLITFEVDTARAERVVGLIPETAVRVAESGVSGAESAQRLCSAGYDAVLVGEHLVTSGDVRASLGELRVSRS